MRARRARSRHALALLTAALAAALATAAEAQFEPLHENRDVGEKVGEATGTPLDTDHTPVAKDTDIWEQVAGAKHGASDAKGSLTPFDLDLFAVVFRNPEQGFAGGARCERTDPDTPVTGEATNSCRRLPSLWRYRVEPGQPPRWEQAELPGSERQGYVGAIAWIAPGRALAVGGTGEYPRRERSWQELGVSSYADWVEKDPAGKARAWLYEDGHWRELEVPDDARGLSAVAYHANGHFGVAGALGQLWHLDTNGRFTQKIDRDTDQQLPDRTKRRIRYANLFEYRVRDIEFVPRGPVSQVFAVTAGCCARDPLYNTPRLLAYDGPQDRWFVRMLGSDPTDRVSSPFLAEQNVEERTGTDGRGLAPEDQDKNHRRINTRRGVPDSYYSLLARVLNAEETRFGVSVIASAGGPRAGGESVPEPASVLVDPSSTTWSPAGTNLNASASNGKDVRHDGSSSQSIFTAPLEHGDATNNYRFSSARLVAGDGDLADVSSGRSDGLPDWMVGEQLSTDANLGGRALVVGTDPRLRPTEMTAVEPHCGDGYDSTCRLQRLQGGDQPGLNTDTLLASKAAIYYKLPSYRLNALDVIGATGQGWAVGDHGAIARMGGGSQIKGALAEPPPARVGERREAPLPERSPLDSFRPAPALGAAGSVPTLSEQPRERLSEPKLVGAGSPDPTRPASELKEAPRWIVMSRDGSEGWALGPHGNGDFTAHGNVATLHHYDGSAWRRCDPEGLPETLAPDRACAALAPLRRYIQRNPFTGAEAFLPLELRAAARVPLEADDDPSNDDEFELVALGTEYQPPGEAERCVMLRYRRGVWALEDAETTGELGTLQGGPSCDRVTDLAFLAPDEGWALSGNDAAGSARLMRFDGTSWRTCGAATKALCGNQGPEGSRLDGGLITANGLTTAGGRLFLFGSRAAANRTAGTQPLILHRQRGKCEGEQQAGCWRASGAGHDPGFGAADPDEQGVVEALAVAQRGERFEGWAVGSFARAGASGSGSSPVRVQPGSVPLLRMAPGGQWRRWERQDAVAEALGGGGLLESVRGTTPHGVAILPGGEGDEGGSRALIAQRGTINNLFSFNPRRGRWELLPENPLRGSRAHAVWALAPDGEGGLWLVADDDVTGVERHFYFYRYSERPRREVFEELGHPITDRQLTALAGAPDGTLWAATASDVLYRYDRLAGWARVGVPGWDPGRVVTRPSQMRAIATGPDGRGLAVGEEGRIAELSAGGVALDPAAGTRCAAGAPRAPCGTGRDLGAVALAPDGSAMAGGEARALLWRPAGGAFRALEPPPSSLSATITGISLPEPYHAWLALDTGQVFAGERSGERWSWRAEGIIEQGERRGDLLARDRQEIEIPLRAIAIDSEGHGYAVGERGVILERTRAEGQSWRRLQSGFLDDFTSVALPAGGGEGALVGGERGVILTRTGGRFQLARAGEIARRLNNAVIGLALMPGAQPGQVEAWAGLGGGEEGFRPGASQLLHYASDPGDPLLNPSRRAQALPDAPAPREGELSFAALGKSDCRVFTCGPLEGTQEDHEAQLRAASEELVERSQAGGGPGFALFTGDVYESGGDPLREESGQSAVALVSGKGQSASTKYRRFAELYLDRLADAGLPLFGAIGAQDVTEAVVCDPTANTSIVTGIQCYSTREQLKAGTSVPWRRGMASQPAPWGRGGEVESGRYRFEALADSPLARRLDDQRVEDPDGEGPAEAAEYELGEARTHYALEVVDQRSGEELARLVFVDSSLRSLAAGEPNQNPLEPRGGQSAWLERMLCFSGEQTASGERCTRAREQAAIVVSNTPSYSYGPGAGAETQTDASAFEALLLRHKANVVVSGRLGWNGRYWATAPGVHEPCPGGEHPRDQDVPQPGTRVCGRSQADLPLDPAAAAPAAAAVSDALRSLAPPPPPALGQASQALGQSADQSGLLPFVVASSAGGALADEQGTARAGFWRGYTLVRLDRSGDPRSVIVEQRPVFDWISLTAQQHVLQAGQRMTLRGVGREVVGNGRLSNSDIRFDRIDGPAITHRYDLLEADPERPYLPRRDADGDYVPLDPLIGRVDSQSGLVRAGRGNQRRSYAVGVLSVADEVATYPLVFEPGKSFRAKPAPLIAPPLPPRAPAPAPPQIRVLGQPPVPPPATPPPPAQLPNLAELNLPAPPALPPLPGTPAAGPVNPPPPPAPPAPPATPAAQPLALNALLGQTGVTPSPIPPNAPAVNPAPPSGSAARKEAKQRQAATAKSEEGEASPRESGVDLGEGPSVPHGAQMTRRDRIKPAESFTPLHRPEQASAWSRGALYGGGLGLAAATLALGFTILRPTPRRRGPVVPAPAFVRAWRRGE